MKLRILGNSIRLRLTKSDIDALMTDGRVGEFARFPDGSAFYYGVDRSRKNSRVSAVFDGESLVVRIQDADVEEWAETDQVGIEAHLPLEGGESLHVLVEKDFQCLHRDAPNEDAFPHPEAAS